MELTLGELAEKLDARVIGDRGVIIHNVAGIREAKPGDITFLANAKYQSYLGSTRASAVILQAQTEPLELPKLVTPHPYRAFVAVLGLFARPGARPEPGIATTAVVSPDVRIGADVAVGEHVVVRPGAVIGEGTVISAGTYIGDRVRIGQGCRIHPGVVILEGVQIGSSVVLHPGVVLGSDGFGYLAEETGNRKIPQIGGVVIEDDVEIGANSTVDRATIGVTRICRGTRIDNLVHVGHNVEIGEHSLLCAQVGISGSTRLGKRVTLAGQAGLVGHIEIGDGARVGAQGGVTKSIPHGQNVSGYPAMDHGKAQRIYASMRRLPDALRCLKDLEHRIAELERSAARPAPAAPGAAPEPEEP